MRPTLSSRLFQLLLGLCFALPLVAQDEEHYTKEVGLGLGTGFMLNDANARLYGDARPAGAFLFRFVLNPRMAVRLHLGHQRIGGSVQKVKNFYPAHSDKASSERLQYSFSGGITDVGAVYELHFLPYGYYRGYLGLRRFVPFLQMGVGLAYSDVGRRAALHFPLGFGLKYKITPRLNLGLDWRMQLSMSDQLEGLDGPTGIRSEMMRNTDHMGQTLLTLTYDFSPTCPTCNKAD
ncbi:MAG: hypothetical protein Q4D66_05500 [Bacteroidales bacterium]|nr:hypothetical protein [Bacteroidales bacterium]